MYRYELMSVSICVNLLQAKVTYMVLCSREVISRTGIILRSRLIIVVTAVNSRLYPKNI